MIFCNHSAAFEFLKHKHDGLFDHINYRNYGRHMLIYLKSGEVLYCLFKHEFLHSFNFIAPSIVREFPEFAGYGESINVDDFVYAKTIGATLIYIYPSGKVYKVYPNLVARVSVVYDQKRVNKYIEDSMHVERTEKVRIFPCKILEEVGV